MRTVKLKAGVASRPSTPTVEIARHTVFRCKICKARAEAHHLRSYVLHAQVSFLKSGDRGVHGSGRSWLYSRVSYCTKVDPAITRRIHVHYNSCMTAKANIVVLCKGKGPYDVLRFST